jgi:hypothetical protein
MISNFNSTRSIYREVISCSLLDYWLFGRTYSLNFSIENINQTSKQGGFCQNTRSHIPEDSTLHCHRSEKLISQFITLRDTWTKCYPIGSCVKMFSRERNEIQESRVPFLPRPHGESSSLLFPSLPLQGTPYSWHSPRALGKVRNCSRWGGGLVQLVP